MSFILVDNVFDGVNGILPGQKLVLLALAKFSDQNGKSWPSVQTIARATKQSIRTVQTHIASLLKLGFLKRIYRSGRSAITILTSRVTGVLTPVQTPANSAYPPLQILHPEEVIQSINQKTAQSQIDSIAAAADIIVFETKTPEVQHPTAAVPAPTETMLPAPATAETMLPAPATTETVNPFADVEPQLIVDFGIVRKHKKKSSAVTNTEAQVFAEQASIAGLTVAQAVRECVLRGWARFEASWLPAKPPETTVAVFTPEVAQPVTPAIKSAGLAGLTALRATMGASADPLSWAKNAIGRDAAGERIGSALLRNAKLALRI